MDENKKVVGYIVYGTRVIGCPLNPKAVGKGYYTDLEDAIEACYSHVEDILKYAPLSPVKFTNGYSIVMITEDEMEQIEYQFMILEVYE